MDTQIPSTKTAMVPVSPPIRSCIRYFAGRKNTMPPEGGIVEKAWTSVTQ
ncbi:hypothetical protein [Rhodanobacter sp. C03]|nr:hypothetical protein [Rhodanobacter sp. C03]